MQKYWNQLLQWIERIEARTARRGVLIITGILTASALYFLLYELTAVKIKTPCTPNVYPANCYHVNADLCESLWQKSDITCREEIRKLSLPPGKMISPILFKCQVASLDRLIASTRISNPGCDRLFQELEMWKKTNPDILSELPRVRQ